MVMGASWEGVRDGRVLESRRDGYEKGAGAAAGTGGISYVYIQWIFLGPMYACMSRAGWVTEVIGLRISLMSRTRSLARETALCMLTAGCWLLAAGGNM